MSDSTTGDARDGCSPHAPAPGSLGGRLRRGLAVAGAVATVGLVAACGSSSDGGSTGGTSAPSTGGASTSASTGGGASAVKIPQSDGGFPAIDSADKAPTGQPLKFAMISQENSASGSFPEQRQAGEAAIKYVNTKLGGIAGRPIQLSVCKTDGQPATSASCANKLLRENPVAFIGASDFATFQSLPLLQKAGVAFIGGLSFGGPEALLPNSFLFISGSTTAWPAIPQYAIQKTGAKTIALTEPTGNPGAKIAADLVRNAAEMLGATTKTVSLDPSAADVTPQITELNAGNPDAIVGINTGTQCVALAQARKSLGVKADFYLPGGCSDPKQIAQLGDAANGIYMPFEVAVPGDDGADVQLYDAAMKQWAPETARNEFAASGFQSVMNIYTVLNTMKPDAITPAAIIKAFQGARGVHNFMGPDFSCDKPVPAYPSVCNPKQMMAQYQGDKFVPMSDFYDPSKFVKLSAASG
jgi:branched-chain amino acid transport system substrate-binding protein